uniref:Uncharacterized protein n=1 Tax=viral metagenome TaxID=1070528 RepID=A0A6H1ZAR3_9ZZZZ
MSPKVQKKYKILTRSIGDATNPDKGIESAHDVEGYLDYLEDVEKLELFATHYLGPVAGVDAFNVMFILKAQKAV